MNEEQKGSDCPGKKALEILPAIAPNVFWLYMILALVILECKLWSYCVANNTCICAQACSYLCKKIEIFEILSGMNAFI